MELHSQIAEDLEKGVNQGVVAPAEAKPQAVLDMSMFPITAPDSNQDRWLSDFDSQIGLYFDTMGCNIFSSVGGLEMYINALGGDPDYKGEGGGCELSERDLCVDAGLDGSMGSSEEQWEAAVSKCGFVRWDAFPWDERKTKREEFFSKPTPDGTPALRKYLPCHRPVGTDDASLIEALKYGAVKIFIGTGPGWNNGEPFVIPKNNNPMGHAVLLRRIDSKGKHIRDQYAPYVKCLAPDYIVYYAFQTLLLKKPQNNMLKVTMNADGKTVYIEGEKGKLGLADEASLKLLSSLTSDPPVASDPKVPQIGILEQGFNVHK